MRQEFLIFIIRHFSKKKHFLKVDTKLMNFDKLMRHFALSKQGVFLFFDSETIAL